MLIFLFSCKPDKIFICQNYEYFWFSYEIFRSICCAFALRHRVVVHHPLRLEVCINPKPLKSQHLVFSSGKWFSSHVMSLRHHVCCWQLGTMSGRVDCPFKWPWLIGVWSLSLPPTSIWKSFTKVWNMNAANVVIYSFVRHSLWSS